MSQEVLIPYAVICWALVKLKIIKFTKKNLIIMIAGYFIINTSLLMFARYYSFLDITETTTVKARNIALVSPNGTFITDIYVRQGQHVKKGEPVFRYSTKIQRHLKEQYIATYNSINMKLKKELIILDKFEKLENKVYTAVQVKNQRYKVESKRESLKKAKANIDNTQWTIDHAIIRAPVSGYTNITYQSIGQYWKPNAKSSSIVIYSDNKYIELRIPDQVYNFIQVGAFAEFFVNAYPGKIFKAKVQSITRYTGNAQGSQKANIKRTTETTRIFAATRSSYGRTVILSFKDPKGINIPMGAVGSVWIYSPKPTPLLHFLDIIMSLLLRVMSMESYIKAI